MTLNVSAQKFQALDACHLQIYQHLHALSDLLKQLDLDNHAANCRQQAQTIEAFFSGTSRQHHEDEEKNVFPTLLASTDAELVHTVKTLQQDHCWIEQNWLELGPMLRGIAQSEDWPDLAELKHYVAVFVSLCHDHITLEEALIYPKAKSMLAQELAERAKRQG